MALKLVGAETEEEVINILTLQGVWKDIKCWHPYGDNENNFSIIGNQQSSADAALVEKLINSVDAVLMKECAICGIDAMGSSAPRSVAEALEKFYHIRHGQIFSMNSKNRNDMSKNIILAATGKQRGEENIVIVDRGEGQSPNSMPNTILSISKSNKLKIPFVQGKFNMGGTGALPFCGKHHMELIISKRCPDIPAGYDTTASEWSITIVRKEAAREGRKSSMYTYLTGHDGRILNFTSNSMPIIPECEGKDIQNMEFGTFIKLFNYEMTGYKTNIIMDFNYRLSLLIPDLAHPIRIRECRKGFSGHTFATTLSGMITRLYDDRSNNIENDFPSSDTFVVDAQEFTCSIYLFKKGKQVNYRNKHEGVLFIVNGQTQGILHDTFFNRLNLSYLKDSLLVVVDCSDIDIEHQENLFMTSRDRLRISEFSKELESRLGDILKNHSGLRAAEYFRREEALKDKIADNGPLKDILQNILAQSSVLNSLFLRGTAIKFSGKSINGGIPKVFKGKKYPTYFRLVGKIKAGIFSKHVPINHSFRVQFETDVQNDYFSRPEDAGYFILKVNGEICENLKQSLNLFNGIATLTISIPTDAIVGSTYLFETAIEDDCIVDHLENRFEIVIEEAKNNGIGGSGGHRTSYTGDGKNSKNNQDGFAMPEIICVNKDNWYKYDMNQYSAMIYKSTEEGGDYYLNSDNAYLLAELRGIQDKNKIKLTEFRYKCSMALIAMSIIGYYKNNKNNNENIDISDEVSRITTMVAPVIVPMLETMSKIDINKVAIISTAV